MKKIIALFTLIMASPFAMADNSHPHVVLDKVFFQVSAKQWVSTQSVLMTVTVNASLNNADLVKARGDIINRLNSLVKGEWHITQFDRSQDSSGLDKLYVNAQIRVPQTGLNNDIYQQAKNVSKPGATYTVASIEFKPSLAEMQQVKMHLRQQLYQQVKAEMLQLNQVYGDQQHYTVSRLYLFDGEAIGMQPKAARAHEMSAMVMTAASPNLAVSNEVTMTAMVEAASNRQGEKVVANPVH